MRGLRGLATGIVCIVCIVCPGLLPDAQAAWEDAFAPAGDGPRHDPRADGRRHDRPALAAHHLAPDERIAVDGRLDDPVWSRAAAGHGLVQHEPVRRGEASVQTVFKVAYDDANLYLAAACWEDDMDDVARRLTRRDDIASSDFISFYVDPYHDHLSGYNFRVTADGVKADHYLFEDTGRDADWDAVWQAETTADASGWYLELRIPLAAMRFRSQGSDTWGLQFYRWLHGRGEDTGWATWDRDQSGFVSRWGTLTGMQDAGSPRRLEVRPYVAAGLEDEARPHDHDEALSRYLNLGADLRYNLTSALTAQAAVQPDFGQVELDPAVLNLSPFETFFSEKRPFFVEGARFFEHPSFRLFHSRRIGTDEPGNRLRAAAKLTGKLGPSTSIGVLGAFTDVVHPEVTHNLVKRGERETGYAVARTTHEFADGKHRVGFMGTGVWRQPDPYAATPRRDAYSAGADWELNLGDREWRVAGSAAYTVVDPHGMGDVDPGSREGSAGTLDLRRTSGDWRGGVTGSWKSDRFDPNDIGFLSANDEVYTRAWLQYRHDADGAESLLKSSHSYLQVHRSWLYGEQRQVDPVTGRLLWDHAGGHPQGAGVYLESWSQTHGYQELRFRASLDLAGTSKYATRTFDGRRGPLMSTPRRGEVELRWQSDWRRDLVGSIEGEIGGSEAGDRHLAASWSLRTDVGRHLGLSLAAGYRDSHDDAHWLLNTPHEPGIGGVGHVFAELDQQTVDATLRGSWLPHRDLSLELYLQPYLTAGEYRNPRYLATPDSRDLRPYDPGDGSQPARDRDFTFASFVLNLVLRWEYRPGSTAYLVFTHGRDRYRARATAADGDFDSQLRGELLFDQEPRNTLLLKIDHWFAI